MHEPQRGIFIFCLFFFIAIAVINCGPGIPDRPLLLGTNVWLGYEPFFLAREKNFFEKNFIRLVEATSASEVIQAFRNNARDAAALTLDEVLLLAQSGLEFRVILIVDFSHGADGILGQSGITGVKDVKGRRIGVENTAVGAYMLARALQMISSTGGNSIVRTGEDLIQIMLEQNLLRKQVDMASLIESDMWE